MNLVLVCLLCLPSALALRLDTRLAGQRDSYFFGARSKPTAAPSQTLYSAPPATERESAPASSSGRTSYLYGARSPQVGRLVGEPASDRSGLSREHHEERTSAPASISSEQRSSGKTDYSFGARLRSAPSVQRSEVSSAPEPVFSSRSAETPSARSGKTDYSFGARLRSAPSVQRSEVSSVPEPVFWSRSAETPSARSGKTDYSFGARLSRAPSASSEYPSRASSVRSEETRREEAAPSKTNYSFGARVKPNAAHQMRASTPVDSEVSSSRTSSRPLESSSSASTGRANYSFGARLQAVPSQRTNIATLAVTEISYSRSPGFLSTSSPAAPAVTNYCFGARLLKGGEFETVLKSQRLISQDSHLPPESVDASKETYFFGSRSKSSKNRSGSLVGV